MNAAVDNLSPADISRLYEERVMRDKSYEVYPLGADAAQYLRIQKKRLSENSLDAYESTLDKLARRYAHLRLEDFEPPVGTERLEEFMDSEWGSAKATTYNRHLSALKSFFSFHVKRGRLHGDPTLPIEPAKARKAFRETFSEEQRDAIIASQENLRDRIALRLLLHYGLRRGGLQNIQVKHFDHVRKRLAVHRKGGTVRWLPIPEPAFWHDLERWIIDTEAKPGHYLMPSLRKNRYAQTTLPDKPMTGSGLHKWWYRCLANAGIVAEGETSGERMHKARHTAGQVVLDKTGNLKLAQMLLMHESIQTTGDIYTDYDGATLAALLAGVFTGDDE